MFRPTRSVHGLFLCAAFCAAVSVTAEAAMPAKSSATVPVTTQSAAARQAFERAMSSLENLQTEAAAEHCRAAVKADPEFAMGHLFVAYLTRDPVEQKREFQAARRFASRATPGEQLMTNWLAGSRDNDYVQAIAAMNDLLNQYPDDARLAFLAGRWLNLQEQYEQGERLMARAIAANPNPPPSQLNVIAYAYAHTNNFEKAFAYIERYARALPHEPNPQDSWGEILRMSGRYREAIEHFRAALKLDAKFHSSQAGIAGSFALMGDEERARAEYDKAIKLAPSAADRLDYSIQRALTYVREGRHEEADAAFDAAADEASKAGLELVHAETFRFMAMVAPEYGDAMRHLEMAEKALNGGKTISESDRQEERARVLQVRAMRAAQAGALPVARKAVAQLERMASSSLSHSIQRSYHVADGALLMAQNKFADAVPELEEDMYNPATAELLVAAYRKAGAAAEAEALRRTVGAMHEPTIEDALVRRKRPGDLAVVH